MHDFPLLFDAPDAGLPPRNVHITVQTQEGLLAIYRHLRMVTKTSEYERMSESRNLEIFRELERRAGIVPVQRRKGLRRVDFLSGRFRAQGLVRAQS